MFLAWNLGWGRQRRGKVMLLTEMEDIRGSLGIELGHFLRGVWSNMNNHVKMPARKAI